MAHPQARVAALLGIVIRTTESLDEEEPEAGLGAGKIFLRIEPAEDVIIWDTAIERCHEAGEALLADDAVELGVEKIHLRLGVASRGFTVFLRGLRCEAASGGHSVVNALRSISPR